MVWPFLADSIALAAVEMVIRDVNAAMDNYVCRLDNQRAAGAEVCVRFFEGLVLKGNPRNASILRGANPYFRTGEGRLFVGMTARCKKEARQFLGCTPSFGLWVFEERHKEQMLLPFVGETH